MEDQTYSDAELKRIQMTVSGLLKTLEHNQIPINIASPAVMMVSAHLSASAFNTDEHIVGEFRRCLKEARAQHQASKN